MSDTADLDITSANAEIVLMVDELYPQGVKLSNFSTDGSFATDDVTLTEVRMGVDGHLAAGFTPTPRNVTLTLEANSPSLKIMQNIAQNMTINRTVYKCSMQITVPALHKDFHFTNGVLVTGHLIPDAKKELDPTTWVFTFENCEPSTIA